MPRDKFDHILRILTLWSDEQLDKQDKFSKLRPLIKESNKRFLKFSFNGKNKFIDKSMIPYYGIHGTRQQINKKPILARYNIWVLAEAYGYVVQFKPHQGVKKGK